MEIVSCMAGGGGNALRVWLEEEGTAVPHGPRPDVCMAQLAELS